MFKFVGTLFDEATKAAADDADEREARGGRRGRRGRRGGKAAGDEAAGAEAAAAGRQPPPARQPSRRSPRARAVANAKALALAHHYAVCKTRPTATPTRPPRSRRPLRHARAAAAPPPRQPRCASTVRRRCRGARLAALHGYALRARAPPRRCASPRSACCALATADVRWSPLPPARGAGARAPPA